MHQLTKNIALVLALVLSMGAPLCVHAEDIGPSDSSVNKSKDVAVAPVSASASVSVSASVSASVSTSAATPATVLPITPALPIAPAAALPSAPATAPAAAVLPASSAAAAAEPGVPAGVTPRPKTATAAPASAIAPDTGGVPFLQDALSAKILAMEETDVWGRIRKGFGIPDLDNALVTSQTKWYSTRPDYFNRTTTRASLYLYHVVEELEKRHMPTELALLPFIESAFNPQAYSTAKASGMWQFIPSTGRDFHLKQDIFKDERRDVLASTDAALTYLQKLYGMFGDWQLALAAYNWGEGSVQRAIKKNQAAGLPIDFNSLSIRMPAETQNYVPKLQAVKNIIAEPEKYGIVLPKVDNQPYFVTIGKTRDIDIKVAAQLAELSVAEFKALNPQFNRPVITGNGSTQILLPQSNAEKFKTNLSKWGHALSSWTVHKVTSAREKIETIAAKFGTTPAVIREANNIPPKMRLVAGATVMVPKSALSPEKDISPEVVANATMAIEPDVPPTRRIYVKVGKRDNLASIAKRNKVSTAQIKTWNNLKHDKVAVGQRLALEVPNKVAHGKHHGKQAAPVAKRGYPAKKATSRKHAPTKAHKSATKTTKKPVKKHRAASEK